MCMDHLFFHLAHLLKDIEIQTHSYNRKRLKTLHLSLIHIYQHISKSIGFERELPALIRILDNIVLHHSSDQRFHTVLLDIG